MTHRIHPASISNKPTKKKTHNNRMGLLKKLQSLIKVSDFFYSSEMLRYDDENEYRTMTGGLISLGIITTIIIGFASMIMDTLNLNTISTSLELVKNKVPTPATLSTAPDSRFMFAVEIWQVNLSQTVRYFDVTFRLDFSQHGVLINSTYLPLETCRRDHFSQFPQVSAGFDQLMVGNWLCPPINSTYDLYGKYSSEQYAQYIIEVSACKNETDPLHPCAPFEEIQAFFKEKNSFYFDFYYTNPIINPAEKEYKKFYMDDDSYALFGDTVGSENFLYFTDYTIKTDYSIWPFEDVVEDEGCIVQDAAMNHPFQTNINGSYVTFSLVKSTDSILYHRYVQKISSVFSFMGGMVGAISALLFVVKAYTSLSFQISIALQIFKPDKQSQLLSHLTMNIWNFIKFYFFKLCAAVGKPLDAVSLVYVEECQREIVKQLDVKALIKRLVFVEYCLTYLFEDYQLDALQLKKPRSPSEIRKIRERCESVDEVQPIDENQMAKQVSKDKMESLESDSCDASCRSPEVISVRPTPVYISTVQVKRPTIVAKTKEADLIIVDMLSSDYPQPPSLIPLKKGQTAQRMSQRQYVRLSNLHKDAVKGNAISHKLWNSLQTHLQKEILVHQDIA